MLDNGTGETAFLLALLPLPSIYYSAQFENLGELVKNTIFVA